MHLMIYNEHCLPKQDSCNGSCLQFWRAAEEKAHAAWGLTPAVCLLMACIDQIPTTLNAVFSKVGWRDGSTAEGTCPSRGHLTVTSSSSWQLTAIWNSSSWAPGTCGVLFFFELLCLLGCWMKRKYNNLLCGINNRNHKLTTKYGLTFCCWGCSLRANTEIISFSPQEPGCI